MKIRPANLSDSQGIARTQVDSYRSAYRGIFPAEYLEAFSYQEQENDWRDWFLASTPDALFVAVSEDSDVVGYSLGRKNAFELSPFAGELVALHVRREFQGQGVGKSLFAAVVLELHRQSCGSLFLWVLEANPARGFYEKLGGQLVGIKPWQNNAYFGTAIREFAYGWLEIRDLFGSEFPPTPSTGRE